MYRTESGRPIAVTSSHQVVICDHNSHSRRSHPGYIYDLCPGGYAVR